MGLQILLPGIDCALLKNQDCIKIKNNKNITPSLVNISTWGSRKPTRVGINYKILILWLPKVLSG
jgi:hypothetical protein